MLSQVAFTVHFLFLAFSYLRLREWSTLIPQPIKDSSKLRNQSPLSINHIEYHWRDLGCSCREKLAASKEKLEHGCCYELQKIARKGSGRGGGGVGTWVEASE